jgi:hypothetical protein
MRTVAGRVSLAEQRLTYALARHRGVSPSRLIGDIVRREIAAALDELLAATEEVASAAEVVEIS